jgi:hypothetical protein
MLPFQLKKLSSIVVPDQLTTEKLGEEKTDKKSANKQMAINKRKITT